MASFAGPGEYESPAFLGKAKMGMICSKDGRFKPVKSLVPGPGAYAVSACVVCVCVYPRTGIIIVCIHNSMNSHCSRVHVCTKIIIKFKVQ